MNLQLTNVLLLGCAFHLIFFAFQTSVFIQQTVVNSIRRIPEFNFTGDGYVSLCLTYTVFAISNWLAPSIIALTGAKYGMFLGAVTYVLYSASFIYPTTISFYAAAALIGLGAGPLWTAQGSFLAKNSDPETTSRNAALFWSMLQSSLLLGNIFVYISFNDQSTISDRTRYIVYGVLSSVCALGAIVILFLREATVIPILSTEENPTVVGQFIGALKLAKTSNMLLLSLSFFFTGQLLSFFTGVYGTAIGATTQFGIDAKKFIGLSGVFIGFGEILGGSIFGLMKIRLGSRGSGRDTISTLGFMVLIVAFLLIYINLPPDSSLVEHAKQPTIIHPRVWIVLLSSLLIGFGDACFNTQIYSLLMSNYKDKSLAAFALFKFVQSTGSAVAFLYSTTLNLYYQLYLLAVIAFLATICFCWVEWRHQGANSELVAGNLDKSESRQDIITRNEIYKKNHRLDGDSFDRSSSKIGAHTA